MKVFIALIVFLIFSITTGYYTLKKEPISPIRTIILLMFTLISSYGILKYDTIKSIKWMDFEIKNFEDKVNKITDEALKKIHSEVQEQKVKLKDLNSEAEKTKIEIEKLNENTLKYAFFVIDPFTGTAFPGGGHSVDDMAWAATTDLDRLMVRARTQLNNKQFKLALETAREIEKVFPGFPGAIYIEFLVYKGKNEQGKAIKKANELITIISKCGFPAISKEISDVYKYIIKLKLSNNKKSEASEIAKKALEFWPDDAEIKSAIQ